VPNHVSAVYLKYGGLKQLVYYAMSNLMQKALGLLTNVLSNILLLYIGWSVVPVRKNEDHDTEFFPNCTYTIAVVFMVGY
jgi:hypothetical protein